MPRVDSSKVRGRTTVMPVAVTLRIAKGRMQAWLDAPVIKWDIAPARPHRLCRYEL